MDSKTEVWARKRSAQREVIEKTIKGILERNGISVVMRDFTDDAYRIINALERAGWRIVAQPGKDK